ncbi:MULTISPECIES: LexA family protein [unclassified Lonepinella]|uniref:LexA family protein n=1 Tax=unclassified Lonepinella TaxID=2642006 RepID=UPI0036D940FE
MNNAINNAHYNNTNAMIANDFSYHPIPYFEDRQAMTKNYSRKLDLNLYCIKRPQQTCFIRVTNPDMLAWGIEQNDMLVVEKNDSLSLGDLIVLEIGQQMEVYEFVNHNNGEFIFFPLSSKAHHIKTHNWGELPIIGTVTNTIHQIKPRKDTIKFAA